MTSSPPLHAAPHQARPRQARATAGGSAISQEQGQRLPPATPAYVLRGHACPVHSLDFFAANSRLVSGDASGCIVVWDLVTRRATAAWKGHHGAILRVKGLATGGGERRVVSHGRDHKLRVWRLNVTDEERMGKALPADEAGSQLQHAMQPWLLHCLDVNALNFCAFAMITLPAPDPAPNAGLESSGDGQGMAGLSYASDQPHIFVAVANSISEGGVDIFHLPSQRRVSKIPPDPAVKTGMLMAVDMVLTPSRQLCVASGYEEGTAMVHVQTGDLTADAQLLMSRREWTWEKIYGARAHSQPVLSLAICPPEPTKQQEPPCFLTSSADAVIAKHPLPWPAPADSDEEVVRQQQHDSIAHKPLKLINTKHAGQQSLQTRSDGKLFATAGWDQRVRVYANASMKELAVLKWHREGCFAVAFAEPDSEPMLDSTPENGKRSDAGVAEPRARLGGAGPKFSGRESEGSHAANTAVTAFPQAQLHGGIAAVRTRRSIKALSTHWLAAAGKDHKITLWDVY